MTPPGTPPLRHHPGDGYDPYKWIYAPLTCEHCGADILPDGPDHDGSEMFIDNNGLATCEPQPTPVG